MKKSLKGIFIFIIILSSVFVYAIENSSIGDVSFDKTEVKEDLTSTSQEVKSSFKEQFSNQKDIPDSISFLPKLFFGIEGTISISELIIYSSLWILIFLIINSAISFLSFFKGYSWIISTLILLLVGYSGGIEKGAMIWTGLLGSISILEKMGSWSISILIIILLFAGILLNKLKKILKESTKISQASYDGMKVGAGIAYTKVLGKR